MMENRKWKNIYQSEEDMFFAQKNDTSITISDGVHCVREYAKENITGCTYNGELLFLSLEGNHSILVVDSENMERYISVPDYDTICIIKMVTEQKEVLVLRCSKEDKTSLLLFDCKTEKILFLLPISTKFIDIVLKDSKTALLLCEEERPVPKMYLDEVDDTNVLFWAELEWNQDSTEANLKKTMELFIDNNYETDIGMPIQKVVYSKGIRFPLFDQYLYYWLKQKSFVWNGTYVIYYSHDIRGIIIGNPMGGEVYRIIELPRNVADDENEFYYKYHSNELIVIDKKNGIKRYHIHCKSTKAIDCLNRAYNRAYINKIFLSERGESKNEAFTNILNEAIESCVCEPIEPR